LLFIRQAVARVVKTRDTAGITMRRRLETFIPIVLFAVLVQLLAPIGAVRAVAMALSDPLAMAPICSGLADGSHQPSSPAHPAHDDCCALCAAGHGNAIAIDPPDARPVGLSRPYRPVVWHDGVAAASAARTGSNAQARAPPAIG
jgi:hypothetical protein